MLDQILRHLDALVAFDTRNPPRKIGADGLFAYLRSALPKCEQTFTDHGAGAVSLLAVRGNPRRLFNVHMDTVPAAEGWRSDPFALSVTSDKAYGLGACDIKGAAAALLTVAARSRGDFAILFSSDEEANDARCVSGFLSTQHGFTEAIIAEPTRCEAILMHRGIVSVHARFAGVAGHSSEPRALAENAVHRAVLWAERALSYAREFESRQFEGLNGLRLNLGRIEGGIKGNVIAPSCDLRFGFRPLPSQSVDELVALFRGMAPPAQLLQFEELFRGPPLPAGAGAAAVSQLEDARDLAARLGLPLGDAVNFWTEAALFSAAGLTAIVCGPGDIAQAHGADEWVALEQLQTAASNYQRIIECENV